jgi:hypothetical protein
VAVVGFGVGAEGAAGAAAAVAVGAAVGAEGGASAGAARVGAAGAAEEEPQLEGESRMEGNPHGEAIVGVVASGGEESRMEGKPREEAVVGVVARLGVVTGGVQKQSAVQQ